jgi:pimeloyl-ACP methyl ester carboxylesterase
MLSGEAVTAAANPNLPAPDSLSSRSAVPLKGDWSIKSEPHCPGGSGGVRLVFPLAESTPRKNIANSISGARLLHAPETAHLPSLERADEVNALLLTFLRES